LHKESPPQPGRAHLVTYLVALLAAFAAALRLAAPFLLTLFLGGLLAMLAAPARRRLMAAGLGPRLSAFAVVLLTLVLVLSPIAAVGVLAVRQGMTVGRGVVEDKSLRPDALTQRLPPPARRFLGDPAEIRGRVRQGLQSAGGRITGFALAVTKAIPDLLLQVALALLAFYFFLVDGRRFVSWLLSLGAFDPETEQRLIKAFHDAAVSSVLAGAAAAAVQGTMILCAYAALGIPGAFLAGAGTFLLSWLPFAGSVPASAAGVAYLFSEGETAKAVAMIVIGALISVSDNVVRPLVLKGRQEMHPFVGLVAILGGIALFGLLGIIIGPIIVAMLGALLSAWPDIRRRLGMTARPQRRHGPRGAPLAALLALSLAAPASAQIDPRHRELLQLGLHETLEGRGPLRGYGYLYFNEPDFLGKGRTVRLALAPVYVDTELGLRSAISPNTDLGLGLAGGGYADGYSEIRGGRYLRGESFSGHGLKGALALYHRFNPIGPVPVFGVFRLEERHSFYQRDKQTEPNFTTPPTQAETRLKMGVRAGGVEPVALPGRAAELSLWYEGRWRLNPGTYGYGADRRVEPNAHLFWSRALVAWPFKGDRRLMASLTGGTTRNPDRFSVFRLGGVLPMAAEFPLSMPGYYYEEVSARNFGLLNVSWVRPLSDDLKTWVATVSGATAVVEYAPGLEQPQKWHTGVGAGVGYLGKAWQSFIEYGYGFNAVRGHGNGAHSIALRIQYDFLKAGTPIHDPGRLNRGIETILRPR
jgi:predicted PurR-regulated permease PerM